MAGDDTQAVGPAPPTPPTSPAPEAAPAWFAAWAKAETERREAQDGRIALLGKDLGRLRGKVRGAKRASEPDAGDDGEQDGAEPASAPALTRADLIAAQRLGQVMAELPDSTRARLGEMVEAGRSFVDVLAMAELARSATQKPPAAGGEHQPPPPPGTAASAASRRTRPWPQDMRELAALEKSDPKFFNELMDPNHEFDPSLLPRIKIQR